MKKFFSFLLIFLCLFGVFAYFYLMNAENTAFENWHNAVENLKKSTCYTIGDNIECDGKEEKSTYAYSGDVAEYTVDGVPVFYSREKDGTYIYFYDPDRERWGKTLTDDSDYIFYGYETVERVQKISAFVDSSQVTYNITSGTYKGSSLSGQYVFRGKIYRPTEIELRIKDGNIACIWETAEVTDENGETKTKKEQILIGRFDRTEITLPEDAEEYKQLPEKYSSLIKDTNNGTGLQENQEK